MPPVLLNIPKVVEHIAARSRQTERKEHNRHGDKQLSVDRIPRQCPVPDRKRGTRKHKHTLHPLMRTSELDQPAD